MQEDYIKIIEINYNFKLKWFYFAYCKKFLLSKNCNDEGLTQCI